MATVYTLTENEIKLKTREKNYLKSNLKFKILF